MQVQKVVKAKVVRLTNTKRQILDHEYDGLQRFPQGDIAIGNPKASGAMAKVEGTTES